MKRPSPGTCGDAEPLGRQAPVAVEPQLDRPREPQREPPRLLEIREAMSEMLGEVPMRLAADALIPVSKLLFGRPVLGRAERPARNEPPPRYARKLGEVYCSLDRREMLYNVDTRRRFKCPVRERKRPPIEDDVGGRPHVSRDHPRLGHEPRESSWGI
jgi:hypothetical protein